MADTDRDIEGFEEKTEVEVVNGVLTAHRYAANEWRDIFDDIRKNNSMFIGDQWDLAVETSLKKQGRPVLNLNIELPLIMQLLGLWESRQTQMYVKPVDKFSDEKVAEVINSLSLQIDNSQNIDIEWINLDLLAAGCIGGFGWNRINMDYENDSQGCVKIKSPDNLSILLDPDARDLYGQSDWKFVIRQAWLDREEILHLWPTAVSRVDFEGLSHTKTHWYNDLIRRIMRSKRDESIGLDSYKENDKYLVLEQMRRIKTREWAMMDDFGKIYSVPQSQRHIDYYSGKGFTPIKRTKYSIETKIVMPYLMKYLDGGMIENHKYYPIVCFVPILFSMPIIDGISYLKNLHGVQEEKNRGRGNIQDILARQVTDAKVLPAGENALKKDIELHGAEPGFVGVRATSQGTIESLTGKFPDGYRFYGIENDRDFQRISMQPLAMQGQSESTEETGVLFEAKVRQGIMALAPLFASFEQALKLRERIKLEFIQNYYTDERVFRIMGPEPNEPARELWINKYDPATQKVLNDVSIGRYDVVLDRRPQQRTQQEGEFRSWAEIFKVMPPELQMIFLPDLIRNSPLINRNEVAQKIEQYLQSMMGGGAGGLPQKIPSSSATPQPEPVE